MNVAADVQQDPALAPHFRYYIREVRVVAYSQVSSLDNVLTSIQGRHLVDVCSPSTFRSCTICNMSAGDLRTLIGCILQFLESYKSVKLASMAAAFGVGPDFMDQELAGFIAAGRLPAKIDKVAGVVETSR